MTDFTDRINKEKQQRATAGRFTRLHTVWPWTELFVGNYRPGTLKGIAKYN